MVNCRHIFMTRVSGAPLPYRIPTQTSPSHSHIAAQSSLSLASRVLGVFLSRVMLQMQSLSSLGLKITLCCVAEAAI